MKTVLVNKNVVFINFWSWDIEQWILGIVLILWIIQGARFCSRCIHGCRRFKKENINHFILFLFLLFLSLKLWWMTLPEEWTKIQQCWCWVNSLYLRVMRGTSPSCMIILLMMHTIISNVSFYRNLHVISTM